MSRTRAERIRTQIPCELVAEERVHKGTVVDVSASGLFVQLEAAILPLRGAPVEVRLAQSEWLPPMTVHAEVTRRALVPTFLGRLVHRGVGLRITEVPEGFHESLLMALDGRTPAQAPCVPPADADLPALAAAVEAVDALADRAPEGLAAASEAAGADAAAEGREPVCEKPRAEADSGSAAAGAPPPAASAPGPPRSRRTDALLIYDGHALDDVYDVLESLGARPLRARLSGPTRFDGWQTPPRLVVMPASEALAVPLPADAGEHGVVRVAVADSRSGALGAMLRRLGYDYLVRRPVHAEMLRLLMLRVLYRGPDVRSHERRAAGWPVRVVHGWRRRPATLLDLSRGGARVIVHGEIEMLSWVRLVIPRSATGAAPHRLWGRVVRKRPLAPAPRGAAAPAPCVLALRFEEPIGEPAAGVLEQALRRGVVGPAPAPAAAAWLRVLRRLRRGVRQRWWRAASAPDDGSLGAAQGARERERRRMPRAALRREVVALDPQARVASRVLVGRDIGVGGMRIDPHPEIAVGDRLCLGLHDPVGAPIEVDAHVVRDDGDRGMALAFEHPDSATAARLDALVSALPALEALCGEQAAGIVVARIVPMRRDGDRSPGGGGSA